MVRRQGWYGLLGLLVLTAGLAPAASAAPSTGPTPVLVRLDDASPATARAVHRDVVRLGGEVTHRLPLVDSLAATLPASAVGALAAVDGVRAVSSDRPVTVQATGFTSALGPLAPRVVDAPKAWAAGATGQGVTVAVVDTGIEPLPDLAGRLVPVVDDVTGRTSSCYDLSGEGSCRDSFGHGTFMAGLIAGNGAEAGGAPTGTAPEARVLSVKVAGASGAADVSTVLAAVQWVVSFKERYGIRVLNLSLGTDATTSWEDDPLNYAVERAWDAGIAVVVAAANAGPAAGSIAKPADDPWVITVGAVDARAAPPSGRGGWRAAPSTAPTRPVTPPVPTARAAAPRWRRPWCRASWRPRCRSTPG